MIPLPEHLKTTVTQNVWDACYVALKEEMLKRLSDADVTPIVNGDAPRKPARKYPPHCQHKGCRLKHSGPGSSFMCLKHRKKAA